MKRIFFYVGLLVSNSTAHCMFENLKREFNDIKQSPYTFGCTYLKNWKQLCATALNNAQLLKKMDGTHINQYDALKLEIDIEALETIQNVRLKSIENTLEKKKNHALYNYPTGLLYLIPIALTTMVAYGFLQSKDIALAILGSIITIPGLFISFVIPLIMKEPFLLEIEEKLLIGKYMQTNDPILKLYDH